MIYLKNITKEQQVYVPRQGKSIEGEVRLKAKTTIGSSRISIVVNATEVSDGYLLLTFTLPMKAHSGEYQYEVTDETGVVSAGLLTIEGESDKVQFVNEVIYEQYRG